MNPPTLIALLTLVLALVSITAAAIWWPHPSAPAEEVEEPMPAEPPSR
ncbi:hypothetical protein IU433_29045 [Nocardia puris]|uniref:Uncharacterized protein n=1 Tax=Nocardia puris TaxID=208602 RepID=A0A366D2A7_9NOCA|nr:hypothetical protein [Nocardia puris]MBF6213928.1 hypothetical protein [Nocardia puris]MBF6368567.1 hypothetical protein [Nocardia puris]MBF6463054.1 hypothetical protein [Nocardia puris]RBO84202.1 hypothetical protein DFR74_11721 [Nocardia puris]